MSDTPTISRPFNILTLDGGGIRGTLEAVLLQRIVKTYPKFLRDVDLIAGTSTGGIQALGLAAGKTPGVVAEMYIQASNKIFEDSLWNDLFQQDKIRTADYDNTNLRNFLKMQFGEMKLGELDKKVAIVTFDLDNEHSNPAKRSWKPKIFHNLNGSDSDTESKVLDVATYTSAAPVFFPTHDGFADGGLVANNPSMVALVQAMDPRGVNKKLHDIRLLSIGAGFMPRYIEGSRLDWGALQWAPHLLYIFLEGSIGLVDFQCRQLLGERYLRLNPHLDKIVALDDPSEIPRLVEVAENFDLEPTIEWLDKHWL